MKFPLFALSVMAVIAVFASAAEAQNYPWCARTNLGDEAVNCGFDSFEQCMASLSGGGANGYCIENYTYKPPPRESAEDAAADTAPGQAAVPIPRKKPQRHSTSRPPGQ
jgi:hypothetical protein